MARVYTFTYREEEPEDTVEEAIAALKSGALTIDDLEGLSVTGDCGISADFTVEDE